MKILYLSPGVFDKGGISRYTRFQIQALREILGAENIKAISLLGPIGSKNDLEDDFQIDWHGKSHGWQFIQILRFSIAAILFARKMKPDIIWSGHLNYSALTYSVSELIKAVSIVQTYGREVWTPRQSRPDIHWGFSRCNTILSDCHFTADYITQKYASRKEIPVFWDCVDTNLFTPGRPSKEVLFRYQIPDPEKGFNILTLGRLSKDCEYKGYERLLSLFPRLSKKANLIFGGGGDLVDRLKKQAFELGVSERVYFLGFVDDNDLPDVYRAASVFCLVGDRGLGRGEGIPLTPLEAAACGIPILVGNQDGSREAIVQGINGYALDPFNLDEIVYHLNQFMQDDTLCRKLGLAARKLIEQEHSYSVYKTHISEFINSYKNTMRKIR